LRQPCGYNAHVATWNGIDTPDFDSRLLRNKPKFAFDSLGTAMKKLILKAAIWSAGVEGVLIALMLLADCAVAVGFSEEGVFGVLGFFALYCHAPAEYFLGQWSAAQDIFVIRILVQWCIWFCAFVIIFVLKHVFRNRRLNRDIPTAL